MADELVVALQDMSFDLPVYGAVFIARGTVYEAGDPMVAARPNMFGPLIIAVRGASPPRVAQVRVVGEDADVHKPYGTDFGRVKLVRTAPLPEQTEDLAFQPAEPQRRPAHAWYGKAEPQQERPANVGYG